MMTNLHGATANTKTLKSTSLTGQREPNLKQIISTMSGLVATPIRSTEATHSTTFDMTFDMIEPDDDHSSDYAEERHDAICQMRDIDQGILSEDEE